MDKYEKIPAFNPHSNCQGHGIEMLDCEYTEKDDRDLLVKVLGNYIEKDKSTS